MKNLKLVVLLLIFSPLAMAQSPQLDQLLSFEPTDEISNSMFNNNSKKIIPDIINRYSTDIQIQNYLQQEGIKSIIKQDDSPIPIDVLTSEDLLATGTLHADLSSMIGFYSFKNKYDGNDNGKSKGRAVNLRGGGNFAQGWGVRGLIRLNGQTYEPESGGGSDKWRDNMVKIEVIKPLQVGSHVVNAYVGGGIGSLKQIQEFGGNEDEYKDDVTCFGGGLELPVNLYGSAAYINPMLSYSSTKWDWDYDGGSSGEQTYNAFALGAAMYTFFNCAMFDPCNKDGLGLGDGNYSEGNFCVGSNTGFNVEIGNETTKIDGNPNDFESNNLHTGLEFDIGYFITDGLSINALFEYEGESISDKDSDDKFTQSCIWGGLGLMFHFPVEGPLQHGYAHTSYQTGKEKAKIEGSGPTIENDEDENEFTIGLGYNLFVLKGVALAPELNYVSYTEKNGVEQNASGFYIGVGLKTYLADVF